MRRFLVLTLLSLTLAAADAEVLEVEEGPEVRRYTVEVIIFSYAQDVGTGSEVFVPDEPLVEEIPYIEKLPPTIEPASEAPLWPGLTSDIVILEEENFTMGDIKDRLEKLDVYDPVMHFGWQQSTWPEHDREALALDRFATPPEGLEGELTLYLSRYLHLVVNLQMTQPDPGVGERADPEFSYGDYRTLSELDDLRKPGPVRWLIEEDRIFRSGELRYYDHPKFGVLARVTRVEDEPEEEIDEDGETELLGYPAE